MEKEQSPLPEERTLLCTGAKPKTNLFSQREEILGMFVELYYNCQAVLACVTSFYMGMIKYYSVSTPLSPNRYGNFPHLFLN